MTNHPIYVINTESKFDKFDDFGNCCYHHEAFLSKFNSPEQFQSREIDRIVIDRTIAPDCNYMLRDNLCYTDHKDMYFELMDNLERIFLIRNPSVNKEYIQ